MHLRLRRRSLPSRASPIRLRSRHLIRPRWTHPPHVKEALARCGGPSDCILLYVGQQKQGNFEIVTQ